MTGKCDALTGIHIDDDDIRFVDAFGSLMDIERMCKGAY
jgi:hypothetical protein